LIEKSEASDAYLPSLPTIPKPTSASWIIATSLPPSPTQAMTLPVNCLIDLATSAFYLGEHLQMHTDFEF
jgi:hypothetical protein